MVQYHEQAYKRIETKHKQTDHHKHLSSDQLTNRVTVALAAVQFWNNINNIIRSYNTIAVRVS